MAKESLSSDANVIRIAVSTPAKKAIEDFAAEHGMKEIAVASRLYVWFGKQPEEVQKWVTGLVKLNEGMGARRFAEKIIADAEAGKPKFDHQQGVINQPAPLAKPPEPSPKAPATKRG